MNQTAVKQKNVRTNNIQITEEYIEKYFPVFRVSSLTLDDDFLKYEPICGCDQRLKDSIISTIESNLDDFRMPLIDPSIDKDGNILYQEGNPTTIDKSVLWWESALKNFMPEKNSRMADVKERDIYLAYFIKYLIDKRGYTVKKAWEEVSYLRLNCTDFWQPYTINYGGQEYNEYNKKLLTGSTPVGNWSELSQHRETEQLGCCV